MDSLLYALLFAAEAIGVGAMHPEQPASYGSAARFQPVAQKDSTYFEPPGELPYSPEPERGAKVREERLPKGALLPGDPPGRYVIVPSGWEERSFSMRDGCWANVYDEDGLSGDDVLTIMGPIDIPDVGGGGVFDIQWKDRISSIRTGKRATMVIYDNANLESPLVTIGPGQSANINNAIRTFGEIRSLKITCTK